MSEPLHEIVGAIHIHTTFSDGRADVNTVAQIGTTVGLDFLLFSDHMTLEPLHLGLEGWRGDTLVLIGYEINDRDDKNHYLAFNLRETLPSDLSAPEYVQAVRANGGIGFIAHPDESRTLASLPPYPWVDWSVHQFDGIEIWNHSSEWVERLKPYNVPRHLMGPRSRLQGPPRATLARWDRLSQERRVAGIGGADAHEHLVGWRFLSVKVFPYKVQFKAIRTHLLLEQPLPRDFQAAKQTVYEGLTCARAFVSNFRWGDARTFRFWAGHGHTAHQMGARIPLRPGTVFHVRVPRKAKIVLLCNGAVVASTRACSLDAPAQGPGAYRVEVRRSGKPWIFSNHIVLL